MNMRFLGTKRRCVFLAMPAVMVVALVSFSVHVSAETIMVGWGERVFIEPGGFKLRAKIDTGAVSCSLHAPNAVEYDNDGKKWVRFTITDDDGKERVIDQPVIGTRRIKRHYGQYQLRPVIRMKICLGSVCKEADVNLVDRTGFEFPMLIGRNFMEGSIVVNPSVQYTVEPALAAGARERK